MGLEYVIAYIMDLTLGDPWWLGHPVVWMGKAISFLERRVYGLRFTVYGKELNHKKIAGIILTVIIVGGSFLITWTIIKIAYKLHPVLGLIVTIWGAFVTLSIRGLGEGGGGVYLALEGKNLTLARERLSQIVGRDTKNLRRREIIRGTVESVSENTIDGVVAPLFYLFLGGVPLAFAYKAINTLDSMIGYQNKKYKDFGWAGARLDDIANYMPARIGGVLISLGAFFFKKDGKNAFRVMFRDGRKYHSPNAGLPQGAMAGALRIRLGGINYYQGKKTVKPYLGNPQRELSPIHIKESINLMYLTSSLALILGVFFRWLLS